MLRSLILRVKHLVSLATNASVNAVENKTSNISDLGKTNFTDSDYSNFQNDIINAKKKQKNLVSKSDLDKEVAALAIKVELKA